MPRTVSAARRKLLRSNVVTAQCVIASSVSQETSSDAFKEKRFLDQLRVILSDVTIDRNAVSDQLKHSRTQCETLQTNNIQLNMKLGAAKANLQRMTSQYNACNNKLSKALAECSAVGAKYDQLQLELAEQVNIVRAKDAECARLSKEIGQTTKERDAALKRIYSVDAQKDEAEQKLLKLRLDSENSFSRITKTIPRHQHVQYAATR